MIKVAKELGMRRVADAYRHVIDLGLRWLAAERPTGYIEPPPPPVAPIPPAALDAVSEAQQHVHDLNEICDRLRGILAAKPKRPSTLPDDVERWLGRPE